MTIQAPTRFTIEVHQPGNEPNATPVVRVIPEASYAAQPAITGEPREGVPAPTAFDPGPCRCLDDDDCLADHAND